jgi:hypothetical protein
MKHLTLAALLLAAALPALATKEALPFIENDYAKAVARARTQNVPIFAEAWATW